MASGKSADDIQFQIKFFEKILKVKPDFIEALSALGDLYTKQGEYEKGLAMDRRLAVLRPDDAIILYNLACDYSLLNRLDKSLDCLKQAIDCGYDDFSHLDLDKDLDNLRHDKEYKKFLMKLIGKNETYERSNKAF